MSEKGNATVSFLFAGGVVGWLWWQYNQPKLTYQWLDGNRLQFNLTKGGKGVTGVVGLESEQLNNNISWQGNYAFSVVPQAGSVFFQISDSNMKVIFTQTVNKTA